MNTFGHQFRVTTFGESHGVAVGAIIDGCPAGIPVTAEDIQKELDRRRPGQSSITTQRKEEDQAQILSGIFAGKTLGTPIAVVVYNKDQHSRDYSNLQDIYRPGHADEAWDKKFGFRDYRGGGRSSGRETVGRVIGGAIAKKILKNTDIFAYVTEVGHIQAKTFHRESIENNPVRCADSIIAERMEQAIMEARAQKTSLGGVIELKIVGCPENIGEPVFGKLQARLAEALLSIATVRSFTILPAGISTMFGHESNPLDVGISGGMATGKDITISLGFKPVPSISRFQEMKIKGGGVKPVIVEGRHDPCILPRAVPVVEAMVAMTLADLVLENATSQWN